MRGETFRFCSICHGLKTWSFASGAVWLLLSSASFRKQTAMHPSSCGRILQRILGTTWKSKCLVYAAMGSPMFALARVFVCNNSCAFSLLSLGLRRCPAHISVSVTAACQPVQDEVEKAKAQIAVDTYAAMAEALSLK